MDNSKRKLSVQRLFVTQAFDDFMQELLKPSIHSVRMLSPLPGEARGVAPLEEIQSMNRLFGAVRRKGLAAPNQHPKRPLNALEPRGPVQ